MTIHLNSEQERLLSEAVEAGLAHTTEEAVDKALRTFHSSVVRQRHAGYVRQSRLWELREGLFLGDLSIRTLIEEGRE